MEADVQVVDDSIMEVEEIQDEEQNESQSPRTVIFFEDVRDEQLNENQNVLEMPSDFGNYANATQPLPIVQNEPAEEDELTQPLNPEMLRDFGNDPNENQQLPILLNYPEVQNDPEEQSEPEIQNEPQIQNEPIVISPETPKTTKKRRRSAGSLTPKSPRKLEDSDDNGCTCPICYENWEMCGDHRLISLKCGHLFGHSCIKRWMQECAPGHKCCPTCKTKNTNRDIRFLFAKKICVEDNSEEMRLKNALEEEMRKSATLQLQCSSYKFELEFERKFRMRLESRIKELELNGGASMNNTLASSSQASMANYRLFMEKNVEICKDNGCKVMAYGEQCSTLLISQKSSQSLFPGYGIRYVDIPSFRPASFIHLSTKGVKDVCYNMTNDLFLTATMDRSAKLFNYNNKAVLGMFSPSEDPLWACAFDPEKDKILYLGSQKGYTYIYDLRSSSEILKEFKNEGDFSPVINICAIKVCDSFPCGGFIVCKLTSIGSYEYKSDQTIDSTRLNVEGPFLGMNYNEKSGKLLISTRPNANNATCRHIVGKINKLGNYTVFDPDFTFLGSRVQTGMARAAQLSLESDTIVSAYVQDTKAVTLWSVSSGNRKLQALPVQEAVHDILPIYVNNLTYFAALTDNKCRVYRFTKN